MQWFDKLNIKHLSSFSCKNGVELIFKLEMMYCVANIDKTKLSNNIFQHLLNYLKGLFMYFTWNGTVLSLGKKYPSIFFSSFRFLWSLREILIVSRIGPTSPLPLLEDQFWPIRDTVIRAKSVNSSFNILHDINLNRIENAHSRK